MSKVKETLQQEKKSLANDLDPWVRKWRSMDGGDGQNGNMW
jgi:hypothetical protein